MKYKQVCLNEDCIDEVVDLKFKNKRLEYLLLEFYELLFCSREYRDGDLERLERLQNEPEVKKL